MFDTAPVVGGVTEPADSLQSSGFASRGSRPGSAFSKRAPFTQQCTSLATATATKGPSNGVGPPIITFTCQSRKSGIFKCNVIY